MLHKQFFACDKQKMFLKLNEQNGLVKRCQAMSVVVAKRTSMLDNQNLKCLSSNACTFGQGFKMFLNYVKCDLIKCTWEFCPGGFCPGGACPGGSLSMGILSGGFCPRTH